MDPDPIFLQRVRQSQTDAQREVFALLYRWSSAGVFGDSPAHIYRLWEVPRLLASDGITPVWQGLLHDPQDLGNPFSRQALDLAYKEVATSGVDDQSGRLGELMALQVQVDILSAQERAFRARQASPIRCKMHALARRSGHAHEFGIHARQAIYVADMLAVSQSLDNAPPS